MKTVRMYQDANIAERRKGLQDDIDDLEVIVNSPVAHLLDVDFEPMGVVYPYVGAKYPYYDGREVKTPVAIILPVGPNPRAYEAVILYLKENGLGGYATIREYEPETADRHELTSCRFIVQEDLQVIVTMTAVTPH
jgi:hypothetical protein